MPMSYIIDQRRNLIRITGSGVLTDKEMIQCITDLREDPALQPDMSTLSDMRNVEVAFTAEGIAKMLNIMERTSERRTGAKAAIVVNSEVAFGMGRIFEMRAEVRVDPSFMIFRDMEAACEWLGIENQS